MSYPTRQYVCLVDTYRRPSRRRNTAGRYQVGARNKKEAKRFLQKLIGFGSIIVCNEVQTPELVLNRGEAVQVHNPGASIVPPGVPGVSDRPVYLSVRHAAAPLKNPRSEVSIWQR